MRTALSLCLVLLIAACGSPEQRSDGVTPSEAAALDNAAAKLDDGRIPPDDPQR